MDPIVSGILRVSLASVFALAALHKLRDPGGFTTIVRGYGLVPDRVAPLVTALLAPAEVAAVATLLWPGLASVGAAVAVLLLCVYSGAIGLNLARGRRDIDCGCLGPGHRRSLSGGLLARNALLGGAALLGAWPVTARPLEWLDGVTGVGGVLVVGLLLSAAARLASSGSIVDAPGAARADRRGRVV